MFSLIENLCALEFRFEQESGIFFNMKYFEEKVLAGKLDDAEKYLLGFTMMDDNSFSFKLFFEIRKQKYFEALDRYFFYYCYCAWAFNCGLLGWSLYADYLFLIFQMFV